MKLASAIFLVGLPLFARSMGAPVGHTGAPGDNTCRACHTTFPLNPEGGSVRIQTAVYRPGRAQPVRITVSHPEASRWGFQITARWAKDPNTPAGTFAAVNTETQAQNNGVYATHTQSGTLTGGSGGAKTFEVEWTPPSTEGGDIIFYAAGNAANNSTNNQGDRIYTTNLRIQPDVACAFTERPRIIKIGDSASGNPIGTPGSLMTIEGRDFGAINVTRDASQGYVRNNQYPTELQCISVEVDNRPAPILYVAQQQINFQVPAVPSSGEARVVVRIRNGENRLASDPEIFQMRPYAPAFFTFNGRSVAARASSDGAYIADSLGIAGSRPARPGEWVEVYGTGLGATQSTIAPGFLAPSQPVSITGPLTVIIGGTTLAASDIYYAGWSPGSVNGLYQINVRIPAAAPNGDLPITLMMGVDQSVAGITIPVRAP